MFEPMLAKSCNPNQVGDFIKDPNWWAQQKLDGVRVLITVQDGEVSAISRSGRTYLLPDEAIEPFVGLQGLWRFDGEFVGTGEGILWLFDMPNAEDIVEPDSPYEKRYAGLVAAYHKIFGDDDPDIKLVSVSKTPDEKKTLLDWCRKNDAEGVMFKDKRGKYLSGCRSYDTLKHKFTETVDCVILEVGREGKESCSVGAFHNGVLTDIGSVKMTASQGLGEAKPGQVIEVRYLYVMKKSLRLVQPCFMQFRPDRDPASCNTDQLKYTNKDVKDFPSVRKG